MLTAPDTPQPVRAAIFLLWTSVLISVIGLLLQSPFNGPMLVTVLVVLAIFGLVVFRASQRHNWARYVLLIWTILAVVLYLTGLQDEDRPFRDHILIAASFCAEIGGVYLLFAAPARQWYRRIASA